ncbi:hypothetical protein NDU88_003206 [Pleurodeles waltl]|uniref:Uncharacterized protein n=1 Tax=Pleurodeles waltl TaxID=8319 RepID=A0AAV7LEK8_PLEWA|nr:hypothetical protein NDU88_003206 [Pleurodeles waltl]
MRPRAAGGMKESKSVQDAVHNPDVQVEDPEKEEATQKMPASQKEEESERSKPPEDQREDTDKMNLKSWLPPTTCTKTSLPTTNPQKARTLETPLTYFSVFPGSPDAVLNGAHPYTPWSAEVTCDEPEGEKDNTIKNKGRP